MAKEDMRRTCPTCGAKALLVWLDGQWVRLRDAAARVGLAHQAVYSRLRRGVPLKDALRPARCVRGGHTRSRKVWPWELAASRGWH